jgi:DNA phosphorothioation-associated putative methyltransferase
MALTIKSHKTAIRRYDLSRPLKTAIQDRILNDEYTVFDYGCGRGDDIEVLQIMKFQCSGWDPTHRPNTEQTKADIVNLGFVVNVIEDQDERKDALVQAYKLSQKALIVSALLDISSNQSIYAKEHGDGHVTSRSTFQKLYTQFELREYINQTLDVDAIAAAPGVFYVFKDEKLREQFLENRVKHHVEFAGRPRLTIAQKYEIHRELLEDYVECIYELGRIPKEDEYVRSAEIKEKIGSLKKAYVIVLHLFPDNTIDACRKQRYEDLLVYLALTYFRKYPSLNLLPRSLRNDMKIFFGSYKDAKTAGEKLLFSAGDPKNVTKACRESRIGKQLPEDLYVHKAYIDRLSPLLRVYYGCAEALIGEVEDANIIKFHMKSGKMSYLCYEKFENKPHPRLLNTTTVLLREQRVRFLDYAERENPPVLHRKETMVDIDYPHYKKFKKLTDAEEKAGLLERGTKGFGLRLLWEERLEEVGYKLRGHQLVKNKIRAKELVS